MIELKIGTRVVDCNSYKREGTILAFAQPSAATVHRLAKVRFDGYFFGSKEWVYADYLAPLEGQ